MSPPEARRPRAPRRVERMKANLRSLAAAGELLASLWLSGTAFAQKPGGILRMPSGDSPASMSIHEESTIAALGPMMGVFNNLVMFDQHVKQWRDHLFPPALSLSGTAALQRRRRSDTSQQLRVRR